MTDITKLIGTNLVLSDLVRHPVKLRYTESTVVQAPPQTTGYFRMKFPKKGLWCLDTNTINLKFDLHVTGGDAESTVDAQSIGIIFQRIRVLSGTTVLQDINKVGQLMHLEKLLTSTNSISKYVKNLEGNGTLDDRKAQFQEAKASGAKYITKLGPMNTFLNNRALLPLYAMNDLVVEFHLAHHNTVVYCATDDGTYEIRNVEILCDYTESPSFVQYFNQNPVSYAIQEYVHSPDNVTGQNALLRLSSSLTSLNTTLTVVRPVTQESNQTVDDKHSKFKTGLELKNVDVIENGTLKFEEPISTTEEMWLHLIRAFPQAYESEYFNDEDKKSYDDIKNMVVFSFESAPDFPGISSGIRTSAHNNDLIVKYNQTGVPDNVVADTWMKADARVYLAPGSRDLRVQF